MCSASPQVGFTSLSSTITVWRQVAFGQPVFLLPGGVQVEQGNLENLMDSQPSDSFATSFNLKNCLWARPVVLLMTTKFCIPTCLTESVAGNNWKVQKMCVQNKLLVCQLWWIHWHPQEGALNDTPSKLRARFTVLFSEKSDWLNFGLWYSNVIRSCILKASMSVLYPQSTLDQHSIEISINCSINTLSTLDQQFIDSQPSVNLHVYIDWYSIACLQNSSALECPQPRSWWVSTEVSI